MKVHITFAPETAHEQVLLERAKALLIERFGLRILNERRLARYGVMTAEVGPAALSAIRSLDFVEAVDVDATRHAL